MLTMLTGPPSPITIILLLVDEVRRGLRLISLFVDLCEGLMGFHLIAKIL